MPTPDFDVTTALRFHPVEIVLSMFWKALVIIALGAPPLAVLLFEIVLNGSSMFNHANIGLPPRIDRLLRQFIVTPDMHRVHHSVLRRRNRLQLWLQLPLLGPHFRHVQRPARRRPQGTWKSACRLSRAGQPANLLWSLLLPFRR